MFIRLAAAGAVAVVSAVTVATTPPTLAPVVSSSVSSTTTSTPARSTTTTVSTTTTTVARRASVPHRRARAAVQLAGLVSLAPGSCAASVSGTYFRMLQPGGRPGGPTSGYLANADSSCADKTYTPLSPGTDGGLTLGAYQPEPQPAFDAQGNALAARIVQPASFFGVRFSLATASVDPQTKRAVPAPALTVDGSAIGGDVRALGASWNRGHFNQGSPKPDGATPGLTALPSGTYDAATGAVVVTWTSSIVGGPFDGFTGEWHLAGTIATTASPTTTAAVAAVPVVAASTTPTAVDPALANTGSDGSALVVVAVLLLAVGTSATALAGQRRRGSRTS